MAALTHSAQPSHIASELIKSLPNLPEKLDVAVIATTPASTVPRIVKECADAGRERRDLISAGFGEMGNKSKRSPTHGVEEFSLFGSLLRRALALIAMWTDDKCHMSAVIPSRDMGWLSSQCSIDDQETRLERPR